MSSFLIKLPDSVQFSEDKNDEWIAFCHFHLGDYRKALDEYEKIKSSPGAQSTADDELELNMAVCMFYLGMHSESLEMVEGTKDTPAKARLLFHLMHKLSNEDRLLELHSSLKDILEDQLSLAGMHYLRAHYQEAIDIYKRILLDNK